MLDYCAYCPVVPYEAARVRAVVEAVQSSLAAWGQTG